MSLIAFENTLKNLANDKMQMSYGNNFGVVSELMTITNMLRNLSMAVSGNQMKDSFSMTVGGKIAELENAVVTLGNQRLMMCGINVMSPFMANTPMNNQQFNMGWMPNPMPNPMMYSPQPQFAPQQPMYQPQQMPPPMPAPQPPQFQQQPQYQQPLPQPPPQQAPPPMPAPQQSPPQYQQQSQPQSAPQAPERQPEAQPQSPPPRSSGGGISFDMPGAMGGGGEKAAGRDYLLKLLEEKGG